MRNLDTLGQARRAARVIERYRAPELCLAVRPLKRLARFLVGDQRAPMPAPLERLAPALKRRIPVVKHKHAVRLQPGHPRGLDAGVDACVRADEKARARVAQLVRDLARDVRGIGPGEDAAGHDDAEDDDGEEKRVAAEQQHGLSWAQARGAQARSQPLRPQAVRVVRQDVRLGPLGVDERGLVGYGPGGRAEEEGRQRDARDVDGPAGAHGHGGGSKGVVAGLSGYVDRERPGAVARW